MEYVQDTKLTIRGSRRRTTIPKAIVERLGLSNGSSIRWVLFRDGKIIVLPVSVTIRRAVPPRGSVCSSPSRRNTVFPRKKS
ncbi:MAG: AbrB/MazE/SpoVT family DNA-binding domain-containing protein [Thermoplasmata archaeon]